MQYFTLTNKNIYSLNMETVFWLIIVEYYFICKLLTECNWGYLNENRMIRFVYYCRWVKSFAFILWLGVAQQPPMDDLPSEGSHSRKSPPEGERAGRGGAGSDRGPAGEAIINMPLPLPIPEIHSVGGVLVHMPHVCSCIYTICLIVPLLALPVSAASFFYYYTHADINTKVHNVFFYILKCFLWGYIWILVWLDIVLIAVRDVSVCLID